MCRGGAGVDEGEEGGDKGEDGEGRGEEEEEEEEEEGGGGEEEGGEAEEEGEEEVVALEDEEEEEEEVDDGEVDNMEHTAVKINKDSEGEDGGVMGTESVDERGGSNAISRGVTHVKADDDDDNDVEGGKKVDDDRSSLTTFKSLDLVRVHNLVAPDGTSLTIDTARGVISLSRDDSPKYIFDAHQKYAGVEGCRQMDLYGDISENEISKETPSSGRENVEKEESPEVFVVQDPASKNFSASQLWSDDYVEDFRRGCAAHGWTARDFGSECSSGRMNSRQVVVFEKKYDTNDDLPVWRRDLPSLPSVLRVEAEMRRGRSKAFPSSLICLRELIRHRTTTNFKDLSRSRRRFFDDRSKGRFVQYPSNRGECKIDTRSEVDRKSSVIILRRVLKARMQRRSRRAEEVERKLLLRRIEASSPSPPEIDVVSDCEDRGAPSPHVDTSETETEARVRRRREETSVARATSSRSRPPTGGHFWRSGAMREVFDDATPPVAVGAAMNAVVASKK
eukprot:g5539.t1